MNFGDIKERILSLDIETTAKDPNSPAGDKYFSRIVSIGMSGENSSSERFIKSWDGQTRMDAANEFDSVAKQNSFFRKQNEAGGEFYRYLENFDKAQTFHDAFQDVDMAINRDSILLIQNANFENRHLSEAFKHNPVASKEFFEKLRYESASADMTKQLYVPPSISEKVSHANQAFNDYRSGKSGFDNVAKHYTEMMEKYGEEFNKKDGVIVADLMHFTKATYAKAAEKGYIDPKMIHSNTSMEILSKLFLGESETHGAFSDADQQRRVFGDMTNMYQALSNGTLSDKQKGQLSTLRAISSESEELQVLKGLRSVGDEFNSSTGYSSLTRSGTTYKLTVRDKFSGHESVLTRNSYVRSRARSLAEAHKSYLAKNAPTHGHTEAHKVFSNTVLSGESINPKELDDAIEAKHSKIMEMIDGEAVGESRLQTVARNKLKDFTRTADAAYHNVRNSSELLKRITPGKSGKGYAILAAGAALFGMMDGFGSDDKIQDYKNRKQQQTMDRSLDSTFKMYSPSKPQIYHGTGLANWNERNKHHEY